MLVTCKSMLDLAILVYRALLARAIGLEQAQEFIKMFIQAGDLVCEERGLTPEELADLPAILVQLGPKGETAYWQMVRWCRERFPEIMADHPPWQ